jgi:hypothetical protein
MEIVPRHQCLIYAGPPTKHLRGLATLTKEKLRAKNRCLYLNSPSMVEEMRSSLATAGVDVAQEVRKGALVLSSDQGHLVNDRFDIDRMLGILADAVSQALNDGYSGLWATGDMSWEFANEKNFAKLLEYEYLLEDLFEKQPALSGVCQFHTKDLPVDAIQWALCTHRAVYINEGVSKLNPHYAPAKLFNERQSRVSSAELEAMMAHLAYLSSCAVHL